MLGCTWIPGCQSFAVQCRRLDCPLTYQGDIYCLCDISKQKTCKFSRLRGFDWTQRDFRYRKYLKVEMYKLPLKVPSSVKLPSFHKRIIRTLGMLAILSQSTYSLLVDYSDSLTNVYRILYYHTQLFPKRSLYNFCKSVYSRRIYESCLFSLEYFLLLVYTFLSLAFILHLTD